MAAGPGLASTRLTLWPPKPKELDSTACGRAGRGSLRMWSTSTSGSGSSRLWVGGSSPRCSARMPIAASITPEAPSRCPVTPLVELTGGLAWPNTVPIARSSAASPALVLVPWALR